MRATPALLLLAAFLLPARAAAQPACPLLGAVYKPAKPRAQDTLDFTLTVEKPEDDEGGGSIRSLFFTIEARQKNGGAPVSTLRLGDTCSNGVVVCALSAYAGQYAPTLRDMQDFKTAINFDVLAFSKEFSPLPYNAGEAPDIYILPHTRLAFSSEKTQDKLHWAHFTKFHTGEKVIPDFGGYDVWLLDGCAGDKPRALKKITPARAAP